MAVSRGGNSSQPFVDSEESKLEETHTDERCPPAISIQTQHDGNTSPPCADCETLACQEVHTPEYYYISSNSTSPLSMERKVADFTQEHCHLAKAVFSFQLKTERQAQEIDRLRKANCLKDREIRKWTKLYEQRDKDVNEMVGWIAGFKPVMDENERRIEQLEATNVELKEALKKLKSFATALLVVLLSNHWLNFTTSNYYIKLL